MPVRGILPILVIALAALSSWWLYHQVMQAPPAQEVQDQNPDAFADTIDLSSLDADGRLASRLWAKRMLHYPQDDSSTLEAPYLEVYRPDEPPWQVRARSGRISAGGAEIRLEGNVDIQRAGNATIRPVQITTTVMRVFPEREYAETDAAVTFRSTGLVARSLGMRAYLDQGRVELPARVRATHQPQETR
ncbi:MAG: LPS export ABC transporter periplasmic protein LptC [Gammaproteobacteria bacterium]